MSISWSCMTRCSGRAGVAHVRVEERGRTGDVAHDAWHGQEGRADPLRVGHDHRRRRGRHAGRGHGVLDQRLRAQVVVGERRLQRRQPHHHARMPGPEVDQDVSLACPPCACARVDETARHGDLACRAATAAPRPRRRQCHARRPEPASAPHARQALLGALASSRVVPGRHSGQVDHGPPAARHLGPAQARCPPARTRSPRRPRPRRRGCAPAGPAGRGPGAPPTRRGRSRRPRPGAPRPCRPSGA